MFKVLLVDDEPWGLLGMKNSFNWEELGFEVAFETNDPIDAMSFMESHSVDVVFTDIRMPEMSGINLMRTAREKGISADFIVVSGFSEFEYAKDAIKCGVFDYLLKPINIEEGTLLLKKLYAYLKDKKERIQDYTNFVFLDNLYGNKYSVKDLLITRNLKCLYTHYQVTILNGISFKQMASMFIQMDIDYIVSRMSHLKYCIITNASRDITQELAVYFSNLHVDGEQDSEISIGISTVTSEAEQILVKLNEADVAACGKFADANGKVFIYRTPRKELVKTLFHKQLFGDKDLKEESFLNLNNIIVEEQLSIEEIVLLNNEIAAHCMYLNLHKDLKYELEFKDYKQLFIEFENIDNFITYLKQSVSYFHNADKQFNMQDMKALNDNFRVLLGFINENYSESLSLQMLSEKFHLNLTYICDLFKKNTGKTFSQYVMDCRLSKARELLKHTNMPIAEIAEKVGYDIAYFCTLFKKMYGITSSKFRKGE